MFDVEQVLERQPSMAYVPVPVRALPLKTQDILLDTEDLATVWETGLHGRSTKSTAQITIRLKSQSAWLFKH
jgi:hypothetical protein